MHIPQSSYDHQQKYIGIWVDGKRVPTPGNIIINFI